MADIKVWAVSLCVAAIAGAIIHMLVPNTSLEKLMRLVIGVFFLSCIISPVLTRLPDMKLSVSGKAEQHLAEVQGDLTSAVDGQMQNGMETEVSLLLDKKGVTPENISFGYNTVDKNRISISQIDVVLSPEYAVRETEIREYISDKTGISTVLTFSGAS